MPDADDMDLVRQYADSRSETAFAELVRRHINLIYSTAARYVHNPQDAEDITQAVFVILEKKAAGLRPGTVLTGWLYETARWTSMQFLRTQVRRQRHEQEAYMQSIIDRSGPEETWQQLKPLLEAAMSRLSQKDRTLLALRFFENKNGAETAAAMGIGEWAAHKRTARALEKLQRYFSSHGVDSTASAIAESMARCSIQPAPAALAKSVAAVALAKGAAASISATTLAKATLITMKTKTVVTTIAAAALVVSLGTFFTLHQASPRHFVQPKTETIPIKLPNVGFEVGNANDRFAIDTDSRMKRTPTSQPAQHIKSLATAGTAADFLASTTGGKGWIASSSQIVYRTGTNSLLLGKHIRINGWIKTRDVANRAGATMRVVVGNGHIYALDDLGGHPVRGTTDWQKIESVMDVPNEPAAIIISPSLYGPGEVWFDDFQIEIVPDDTVMTDDRQWHIWGPDNHDYPVTTDTEVLHDGHPTLRLSYTGPVPLLKGSRMWWGKILRNQPEFEQYVGHTVYMKAWIKTEGLGGHFWGGVQPKDSGFKILVKDRMEGGRVTGTTDWTLRTVSCYIPPDTQSIDIGYMLSGNGSVWIDMDSFKIEVTGEVPAGILGRPKN